MAKPIFTCASCGIVEELVTPEDEMDAEFEQYFGKGWDKNDLAIVCDECWQKMHPADHPDLVKQSIAAQPTTKGEKK
jgi:hypothetical protein